MCKKIQKFFTVQLSWLNCFLSSCCGLEFFWNKNSFVCLCGRRNPRTALQLSLQFAVVHKLQKNKDNTLVLHYVQLHAICSILFLYLGIYTQYLIYIEKPVLCTSHSLLLYFFKWEHDFSLQTLLFGEYVS